MPNYEQLRTRFLARTTITESNCWIWNGAVSSNSGHSLATIERDLVYLHRFIFCLVNNLDYKDTSFLACHKDICKSPACWNPDHIYKGTTSDNMKDAVRLKTHKEASKIHCPRGHEYNDSNTSINNGKRVCLACNRQRDRNRKRITVNGVRITVPGTRKL